MRKLIIVTASFAIIACVFFAGALTANAYKWFQPLVKLNITNKTGQEIRSLNIKHVSGRIENHMRLGTLEKEDSKIIFFYIYGEGSYSIEAVLEDGQLISGGAGYVESGYSINEIISPSSVLQSGKVYGY
ncbi:MAG: hypothetical protein QG652_944 [Pseudomonadota bacterium]|nr:hypothetical protein [Pseudomonadota bacterium]